MPNFEGGLNALIQMVRNAKGAYGAQRVQRAADEVPNLTNQYSLDALRKAFTDDNNNAVMTINPSNFERYADPLAGQMDYKPRKSTPDQVVPNLNYNQYIKYLQTLHGNGGFDSVPFLQVNKYNDDALGIAGHEGRHRNRALAGLGDQSTLAILKPRYDFYDDLPRDSQQSFIESFIQKYGTNPSVYREGNGEYKDLGGTLDATDSSILPTPYSNGGPVNA
jgi:hypothetical protein